MAHLFTYFIGILTGLYISAQTKVLSMPTFKLPKNISVDQEAILIALAVGGCLLLVKIATRKKGKGSAKRRSKR